MKLEDGDYVVKDGKLYKPTLVEVKESKGHGCLIFYHNSFAYLNVSRNNRYI